ncbi:hypothetical protein HPP92_013630 [Vanilla planifolia]|uniref:Uncharacterized protein n=1 Tax=Vanilla planifolia TaxID=51239 RepID=A0A835QV94_VANPL|nr:hypothetical protein HPP92_013630 [Vanilla planifolia]
MRSSETLNEPKSHKKSFFPQFQNTVAVLLSNPAAVSLKGQLESAVERLGNRARRVLNLDLPSASNATPPFARITLESGGMTPLSIEKRLSGIPVYALSNAAGEFVLVSGMRTGRSLGLLCLKREDAESLLNQMKSMNQEMREGSKVVAVSLDKVFQLKVDGVAFRLIPDPEQVLNAAKMKDGEVLHDFPGVPVFQSKSLILRSQGKSYRPAFFRKEDLEDSLHKASSEQRKFNPSWRKGDIEVFVLEQIVSTMKGSSTSDWDDILFIPPGFNEANPAKGDKT